MSVFTDTDERLQNNGVTVEMWIGLATVIQSEVSQKEKGKYHILMHIWASLVAQLIKNLPAMRETWVQSLGWKDRLEKGKATHSSILAWRIPRTV